MVITSRNIERELTARCRSSGAENNKAVPDTEEASCQVAETRKENGRGEIARGIGKDTGGFGEERCQTVTNFL